MSLMVEKGIRAGIHHAIHGYVKVNNKYMKDYDKNKKSSYFKYWNLNNLYGWAISQKLPVDGLKWVENTSQVNKDFLKNYNEDSEEGYFLEVVVQYPEKLHDFHYDLQFSLKENKIEKDEKLVANLHNKKEYVLNTIYLKQDLNHISVLKK